MGEEELFGWRTQKGSLIAHSQHNMYIYYMYNSRSIHSLYIYLTSASTLYIYLVASHALVNMVPRLYTLAMILPTVLHIYIYTCTLYCCIPWITYVLAN